MYTHLNPRHRTAFTCTLQHLYHCVPAGASADTYSRLGAYIRIELDWTFTLYIISFTTTGMAWQFDEVHENEARWIDERKGRHFRDMVDILYFPSTRTRRVGRRLIIYISCTYSTYRCYVYVLFLLLALLGKYTPYCNAIRYDAHIGKYSGAHCCSR